MPSPQKKNARVIRVAPPFPAAVVRAFSPHPRRELSRKHRLIPRAVGLSVALWIVAARRFAELSLLQKLRPEFPHRRHLFNLNVAEKTALAEGTRGAEFAGGQRQGDFHARNTSAAIRVEDYIVKEASIEGPALPKKGRNHQGQEGRVRRAYAARDNQEINACSDSLFWPASASHDRGRTGRRARVAVSESLPARRVEKGSDRGRGPSREILHTSPGPGGSC